LGMRSASAGLADPVAIAVALDQALQALLPVSRPGHSLDLEPPSAGGRQNRSSPRSALGVFSTSVRRFTRIRLVFATRPYRRIIDDHAKPLAGYRAIRGALRELLRYPRLHHYLGHDPRSDVREILNGVF
jgi:hypothetical protein